MDNTVLIPVIVSWCACFVLAATVGLRRKHILKNAGRCMQPLFRSSPSKQVLLILLCLLLIGAMLLRNFGLLINCLLCCVGVFGCEFACRDYILSKYGGLYEKGVLTGSGFISFSSIESIPVATWEDRTSAAAGKTELEIVTKKRGIVRIQFSSAEECQRTTDAITAMVTGLQR